MTTCRRSTLALVQVLTAWLASAVPPEQCFAQCPEDLNRDRTVSGGDIGILLGEWGSSGNGTGADLDGNGVVSGSDLGRILGAWGPCPTAEPRVDGLFPEWDGVPPIATDPAGDATGRFDVTRVHASNRGSRLFLRFNSGTTLNLQSGDATDGTLIVEVAMPGGRALAMDLRNRKLWRDNDPASTVSWKDLDCKAAPTYAASDFELSVDLAAFGVTVGSRITINFSSSDSLAAGAPFTMSQTAHTDVRRSPARAPGTACRIASLNTYFTGMLNASRRPKILRLLDAMNADIYCLQEEYTSTPSDLAGYLTAEDLGEDGATWNVHKFGDCAIATRSQLLAIPSPNAAMAVAIVDPPAPGTADALVIFCIHPKCCGYAGSSEDSTRIAQIDALIATLGNLRSGALGPAFEAYRQCPAIVAGDWNLVGSVTPLSMLLDPSGPNMIDALPAHLIGEECLTWRDTSTLPGSFWPGRLDLIVHSSASLRTLGSFVLDTAVLNAGELGSLGLQEADSAASDHLMIVADLARNAPTPPRDAPRDAPPDAPPACQVTLPPGPIR